jgi:hypothetical protein
VYAKEVSADADYEGRDSGVSGELGDLFRVDEAGGDYAAWGDDWDLRADSAEAE